MADKSEIDWCTASLNPFGWGCYGPGGTPDKPMLCMNCYAHAMSKGPYPRCPKCKEFIPHWHPEDLDKARSWKKPREIFWQSMGDMWHPFTRAEHILQVLEVARETPQHVHLFLTKNPSRYLDFASWMPKDAFYGVTVRTQDEARQLVPVILKLSARGFKVLLSMEPLYERVDFMQAAICGAKGFAQFPGIHQIILGGENGRKATTYLHADHVRLVRDQCTDAAIPFFFKGWGEFIYDVDAKLITRVGKAKAGRLLDGVEYNALAWRV